MNGGGASCKLRDTVVQRVGESEFYFKTNGASTVRGEKKNFLGRKKGKRKSPRAKDGAGNYLKEGEKGSLALFVITKEIKTLRRRGGAPLKRETAGRLSESLRMRRRGAP